MRKIKYFLIIFIRLFFSYLNGGQKCIVCGNISYIYPVCNKCQKKHFFIGKNITENRCEKCGRELVSTKKICSKCKEDPVLKNTNKVIPLFSYRLWNKELLFMWKIEGVRNLSFMFAGLIGRALKILGYNLIVPVPPRKGKIKKKGWDQINELCKILTGLYGITVVNLLERISVEEQKKLNRGERLETIKSAYKIADNDTLKKELKKTGGVMPEEVCVIDDVCTTGATIECCSEILKINGVRTVNVLTLFTVD